MNEPLTNSLRSSNFIGKTYNKHPQWYNTPLRLTKEQKHDPILILVDFFECYHLHEVREILWEWLTEVVSSNRSTFNDSYERSNQIYFYEKVEALVESCFILQKKYQKHLNKQERIKLKNQAQRKNRQLKRQLTSLKCPKMNKT